MYKRKRKTGIGREGIIYINFIPSENGNFLRWSNKEESEKYIVF